MNCIPAIVAGVKNIYLSTPALNNKINPAIVYAAKKCGVKKIYKTGGAHSIAAFTYGTKKFEKVDKFQNNYRNGILYDFSQILF